jgi:hypothetical protein
VVARIKVKGLRGAYNKPVKLLDTGNTGTFSISGATAEDGDHIVFFEKDLMSGVGNISDTIILPG